MTGILAETRSWWPCQDPRSNSLASHFKRPGSVPGTFLWHWVRLPPRTLVCTFWYYFTYPSYSTHPFIHPFIHSFIYSFIQIFISSSPMLYKLSNCQSRWITHILHTILLHIEYKFRWFLKHRSPQKQYNFLSALNLYVCIAQCLGNVNIQENVIQ